MTSVLDRLEPIQQKIMRVALDGLRFLCELLREIEDLLSLLGLHDAVEGHNEFQGVFV